MINDLGNLAKFAFVRQQKPLGDGHAILAAAHFIGEDEAVAVLFGDDIIKSEKPAIGQLMEIFAKYNDPVAALEKVPKQNVSKYGIIGGVQLDEKTWEIKNFVEKPKAEEAPSDLAAVGRYIITPEIINTLKTQKPGKDGEIRLADAFISRLSSGKPVYGCQFEGKRYDCGDKLQFVIAQIEMGLEHPEMNEGLKKYLERLNK